VSSSQCEYEPAWPLGLGSAPCGGMPSRHDVAPTGVPVAGEQLWKPYCWVVSLDSVYEYEQAISENTHGTLLMHNTRSASGERYGVHHQ
jgi:hypothetical protein